jgi:alpha-beta hydrolase superfamily lysophospholipase
VPERAVTLVHGFAEHTGRYERLGTWLAERGYAVHGCDLQGHGRSEGPRGHAASFTALVEDTEAFVGWVRREHPGKPLFVFGHSMGGLIVLGLTALRAPELAGVVTSGAALHPAELPPKLQIWALRLLRLLLPRLRLSRPIAEDALSRDPEVGRRYRADPLVFQFMTLSLAWAVYDGARRTLEAAPDVSLPVLLLHGGEDPLVLPTGSRAFYAALGSPGSDLRIYPGLRHEILNEPEWESVAIECVEWMREREAD